MTFSVEIEHPEDVMENGHMVHIFIDKDEIEGLISELERLISTTRFSKLLYTSEEWGIGGLTDKPHAEGNKTTHMLKISIVDKGK